MKLPNHVFKTLQQVAGRYPGAASDAILGKVLNEVAWVHRKEGFGLSRKDGGRYIVHPVLGPIAEDILQLSDGTHWDVLEGAGHGNPLKPHQGESIVPNTPRAWVAPIEPSPEVIIPPPPDKPEPIPPPVVVVPEPPMVPTLTKEDLKAELGVIYRLIAEVVVAEHIGNLYQRLEALQAKVDGLDASSKCRLRW
jgi:hypothetical protein